jgi:hypothetical protein
MHGTRIALACLLAGSVAACVVDDDPGGGGDFGSLSGGGSAGFVGDAGITGDGAASATPMLVKADTNKTMSASPGQGVGVFTEYDAGGHWYISWTCDTSVSNDSCPFDIEVTVKTGKISNGTSDGFASTDQLTTTNDPKTLGATTTTTTMLQGIRFDTDPGAVITVSAALGGEYSGSFLFFVQDGIINGGYTGALTDPLEFEGTSP